MSVVLELLDKGAGRKSLNFVFQLIWMELQQVELKFLAPLMNKLLGCI